MSKRSCPPPPYPPFSVSQFVLANVDKAVRFLYLLLSFYWRETKCLMQNVKYKLFSFTVSLFNTLFWLTGSQMSRVEFIHLSLKKHYPVYILTSTLVCTSMDKLFEATLKGFKENRKLLRFVIWKHLGLNFVDVFADRQKFLPGRSKIEICELKNVLKHFVILCNKIVHSYSI